MNFYITRVIFIIVVGIVIYFISLKRDINIKKQIVLLLAIYILTMFFQPEKLFLKFKSIEAAFKYSFPSEKIMFFTEQNNYGFVISQNNNSKDIIIYNKKNEKWGYVSPIKRNYVVEHPKYTVLFEKIKDSNDYFIFIDTHNENFLSVSDSLEKNYNDFLDKNGYIYYSFVKNKPDNYSISVNGENIYIK
jgi:hypothetical protein